MFRKMYDWVMGLAGSRHAPTSLAVVSFAESSFFPIPPDVMLAPMVLARPERAYFYATVCTIASGIFQFNLALFIALCVVTRGARFFLVAFVLKRWGPPMLAIVEKRLALFTVLFLVLLIGAFFMVKLIGH